MRQRRAQKVLNATYPSGDPRRWEPGMGSTKRDGAHWRARWHFSIGLQIDEYARRVLVGMFGVVRVEDLLDVQRQRDTFISPMPHIRLMAAIQSPRVQSKPE